MSAGTGYLGCQFGVEPTAEIIEPAPFAGEQYLGHNSRYVTVPHKRTSNTIKGFQWDKRTWSKEETENWDSFIEPIWDPSTSEISSSYFQSGIGDNRDLALREVVPEFLDFDLPPQEVIVSQEEIIAFQIGFGGDGIGGIPVVIQPYSESTEVLQETMTLNQWCPVVNHGYFYELNQEHFLFSDASKTEYVSYSGVVSGVGSIANGFNKIELEEYLKPGNPVIARQWQYDQDTGEYEIVVEPKKKASFTGLRDAVSKARASTSDPDVGAIYFDSIDDENPEFMVVHSGVVPSGVSVPHPTVVFNKQLVEHIGGEDVPGSMDVLGITQGEGIEVFNTTFSPIDRTMGVEVFTYISKEAAEGGLYTLWKGIPEERAPVGYEVNVDYDLGIISFGDPEKAAEGQIVPPVGYYVAARYWKTVELEYEPEQTTDLTTGVETNINPVYRKGSRGFVFLSQQDDNPAKIVLRAEEREIALNEYGPIYVGLSYVPVVATAYNQRGQVIEDLTVNFEITSLPVVGSFSGGMLTTSGITDQNGEALGYYAPPKTIEEVAEVCTEDDMTIDNSPSVPSGATQTTSFLLDEIALRGTEKDIFIYKVLKDDLIQGHQYLTVGTTTQEQATEYYRQFFIEQGIYGPTGLITGTTTPSNKAVVWEAMRRFMWNLQRPVIFGTGSGRKTIVAFLDGEALNPHTFTQGAIYPFQPVVVESSGSGQFNVIYNTSVYSLDAPTGTDSHHGYMIVGPTLVKIQAYAYNSRLRRNIYSNEIQIDIDIPPYAKGVWEVELLNTLTDSEISPLLEAAMEGKMVPFGWRIRSTNVTLAAAINAVTFLDKTNADGQITQDTVGVLWTTGGGTPV